MALSQLLLLAAVVARVADGQLNIGADVWAFTSTPIAPAEATVGETITFEWFGTHNVYVHPTGTCSEDEATEVGTSSPATYTFTADDADAGVVTFACDIGSHCEDGNMLLRVTVQAATTEAPAPAPVIASTPAPVQAPVVATPVEIPPVSFAPIAIQPIVVPPFTFPPAVVNSTPPPTGAGNTTAPAATSTNAPTGSIAVSEAPSSTPSDVPSDMPSNMPVASPVDGGTGAGTPPPSGTDAPTPPGQGGNVADGPTQAPATESGSAMWTTAATLGVTTSLYLYLWF